MGGALCRFVGWQDREFSGVEGVSRGGGSKDSLECSSSSVESPIELHFWTRPTTRLEIELSHGGVGFFAGPLHGGARRDSIGKAVNKHVLLNHHSFSFFYPLVSTQILTTNRPGYHYRMIREKKVRKLNHHPSVASHVRRCIQPSPLPLETRSLCFAMLPVFSPDLGFRSSHFAVCMTSQTPTPTKASLPSHCPHS